MHRRSFLKGAGIVTILVAGGAVWRAEDQGVFSVGQGPALAKFVPLSLLRWMVSDKEDPYLKLLLTPPTFGVIAVRDRYDQEQSLRAGRIWQRAHLLATVRQLAARPANEAVEMVDHERKLGREPQHAKLLAQLTGDATWQPTFTFYMGYPIRQAPASPRRAVQDVVF